MNDLSKSGTVKRARAPAKSKRRPALYVALHSTQLSRCLAHGLLFESGERTLVPFLAPVPEEVLEGARQGLEYGCVVLVEIEAGRSGNEKNDDSLPIEAAPLHVYPLAWVKRAVFRSRLEHDDFLARASTYDDVPVDVVEYCVDASLFGTSGLLGADPAIRGATQGEVTGPSKSIAIGKISGALAAVLAGNRWAGGPRTGHVAELQAAIEATAVDGRPDTFIKALAGAIDTLPGAAQGTVLVGMGAAVLSELGNGAGFDVDRFLADTCGHGRLGGVDPEMLSKFEVRADAVLSGIAELRDDAFADAEGKVALRALLLFMLNPDIEALQKVRNRMPDIGQGVFSLALALAGCKGGIASFSSSTKAPKPSVFFGTTLVAWQIFFRLPVGLKSIARWTPDGSYETSLLIDDLVLTNASLPTPVPLVELKFVLERTGILAAFDHATGALTWQSNAGSGHQFFAHASNSPTLPTADCIDICIHINAKLLPTGILRACADACSETRQSGVFARQSAIGKVKVLELRIACLADRLSPEVIIAAQDTLRKQASALQDKEASKR